MLQFTQFNCSVAEVHLSSSTNDIYVEIAIYSHFIYFHFDVVEFFKSFYRLFISSLPMPTLFLLCMQLLSRATLNTF